MLERKEDGTYTFALVGCLNGGWTVNGWFHFAENGLLETNRHGAVSVQRSRMGAQHREHKGWRELAFINDTSIVHNVLNFLTMPLTMPSTTPLPMPLTMQRCHWQCHSPCC